MHRVEHGSDVIVGRDRLHAEQALAVRRLATFLEPALVGEEGLALHEEQREGRQTDVRHRIAHLTAAAFIGETRTRRANAV